MASEDFAEELRYHQAADLLRYAADAIAMARSILEQTRFASSPFALEAFARLTSLEALSQSAQTMDGADRALDVLTALRERTTVSPEGTGPLWRAFMLERINARLNLVGSACARVLLRMMDEPGEPVSVAELARAAGIRSRSTGVIKVYVCRLRNALVAQGIPATAIETGLRSYSLDAEMISLITELLNDECVSS